MAQPLQLQQHVDLVYDWPRPQISVLQKGSPQTFVFLKYLAIPTPLDLLYKKLSCRPGDAMFPKGSVFAGWVCHF